MLFSRKSASVLLFCTMLSLLGQGTSLAATTPREPLETVESVWLFDEQTNEHLTQRTAKVRNDRHDQLGISIRQRQNKGKYYSELALVYEFPSLDMAALDDRLSITIDGTTLGSCPFQKIPDYPHGYQTIFTGRETEELFFLHTLRKQLSKGESVVLGFTTAGQPKEERFFSLKNSFESINTAITKSYQNLFDTKANRFFLNYRVNGGSLDLLAKLSILDVAFDTQVSQNQQSSKEKALLLARHKHPGIPQSFLASVVNAVYDNELPTEQAVDGPALLRKHFPTLAEKSIHSYISALRAGEATEHDIQNYSPVADLLDEKGDSTPAPSFAWSSDRNVNSLTNIHQAWITNQYGDVFGLTVHFPTGNLPTPVIKLFYTLNDRRPAQDLSRKTWLLIDNRVIAAFQARQKGMASNQYVFELDGTDTGLGDPLLFAERIITHLRKGITARLVYAENSRQNQVVAFSLHDSGKHIGNLLNTSGQVLFDRVRNDPHVTLPINDFSLNMLLGFFIRDVFNTALIGRRNGTLFDQLVIDIAATYPMLPVNHLISLVSEAFHSFSESLKDQADIDAKVQSLITTSAYSLDQYMSDITEQQTDPRFSSFFATKTESHTDENRSHSQPIPTAKKTGQWQTELLHGENGTMQHLAMITNPTGEVFGITIDLVKVNGRLYPDLSLLFIVSAGDAAHHTELPVDIIVDQRVIGTFRAQKVLGKNRTFLVRPPLQASEQELSTFRYLVSALKNGRTITIEQVRDPAQKKYETFSLAGADEAISTILTSSYRILFGISPEASPIGPDVQYSELASIVRLTEIFHPEPDRLIAGVLDRILAANPKNISILTARCRARGNLGMYTEAGQDCEESIRLERLYGPAYNELGAVHLMTGNVYEAKRNFQLSCESGSKLGCFNFEGMTGLTLPAVPGHLETLAQKVKDLQHNGDWDKVIATTTEILSWDDKNTAAFAARAEAHAKKGMLDRAEDDARDALRWSPYSGAAHNHLGFVQELRGNRSKAILLYGRACNYLYDEGCTNLQRVVSSR